MPVPGILNTDLPIKYFRVSSLYPDTINNSEQLPANVRTDEVDETSAIRTISARKRKVGPISPDDFKGNFTLSFLVNLIHNYSDLFTF